MKEAKHTMYTIWYRLTPTSHWQRSACDPLHEYSTALTVANVVLTALLRGGHLQAQVSPRYTTNPLNISLMCYDDVPPL